MGLCSALYCCYILLCVGVVLLRVVCCVLFIRGCLFCCFPFCSSYIVLVLFFILATCARFFFAVLVLFVCFVLFFAVLVLFVCFVASGGLNIPSINPTQPSELFQSYFISRLVFACSLCLFALFLFAVLSALMIKALFETKRNPRFKAWAFALCFCFMGILN